MHHTVRQLKQSPFGFPQIITAYNQRHNEGRPLRVQHLGALNCIKLVCTITCCYYVNDELRMKSTRKVMQLVILPLDAETFRYAAAHLNLLYLSLQLSTP